MKITVKVDDIEIVIDEQLSGRMTTMQYADQNRQIQETIKVMVEQCIELYQISNNHKP